MVRNLLNWKKKSQPIKIYRRSLKAIKYNFDVIQSQQGTEIYMIANDTIEKLYSLLGRRATGTTSDELTNEAITLINSLFKNEMIKITIILFATHISGFEIYKKNISNNWF